MAEIRINATGELKLYDSDDSNYVSFKSGGTVSSDVTWTLPTADGSNGQALTTNGSGTLSWADAGSSDPSSADGDSLGTASAEWSDLYLADGGIVYFGNDQDIRLTHNADKGLILKHSATADDKPVILTLQTGETDIAQDDVLGKIEFQAPDEGTGTDAILVAAAIQAVSEGDFSSSSNATSLQFMTGSSEAAAEKMTLTSGGILNTTKLGVITDHDLGAGIHIRTSDSSASVESDFDDLVIESSTHNGMTFLSGTGTQSNIAFGDSGDADIGRIAYDHNGDYMAFHANAAEAIRIDSSGHLLVNATAQTVGASLAVKNDTTETTLEIVNVSTSGAHRCVDFRNGDGDLGGSININTGSDSVSFETSSDYRLKENVVDLTGAITRIKNLKPKRFNFKKDKDTTLDGFLAHEAQAVVPQAVSGVKDGTETRKNIVINNKGNVIACDITEAEWTKRKSDGEFANDTEWFASKEFIVKQGIDQAKLVPLLTAALQEAITRIEALEG